MEVFWKDLRYNLASTVKQSFLRIVLTETELPGLVLQPACANRQRNFQGITKNGLFRFKSQQSVKFGN